jgi:hypothetical protein
MRVVSGLAAVREADEAADAASEERPEQVRVGRDLGPLLRRHAGGGPSTQTAILPLGLRFNQLAPASPSRTD